MNSPLVSVIIPNYNHARYLPDRIESVLGQTYPHFEVIILDDCSTDNSREVIEKYRTNPHVSQIVYNEVNSGSVFRQWKKGLSFAKGDLLWIAESDDRCENTFLERLTRSFEEFPSLSLTFSRSLLFNDTGKTWTMDSEGLTEGFYESHTFLTKFMSRGCPMLNASSCVFSKSAFEKIDDRYTEFRCSGDRMFWTLIAEQGDVAVIGDRLNHFRRHSENVTSYGFRNGINQRETRLILDYIYEKGYISHETYKEIRRKYLKKFVFELLEDKKLKKEIYQFWDFSFAEQLSLKLEAYCQKIKK